MARSLLALVTSAMLIAIAGYAVDRRYGHDAFPRSGVLIVALGAALAGREIYRGERAIARDEKRVEKIEAAYLDAERANGNQPSPEAFTRLATTLGEYRQAPLDHVGKMIYAEICVVCAGPLIWGFGDLVV